MLDYAHCDVCPRFDFVSKPSHRFCQHTCQLASAKGAKREVAFGPLLNSVCEHWVTFQKKDLNSRSIGGWTDFGHEKSSDVQTGLYRHGHLCRLVVGEVVSNDFTL